MSKKGFFLAAGLAAIATVSAHSCSDLIPQMANESDIAFYSSCPDSTFDYMLGINHSWSGPFEMSGIKTVGWFATGYLGPKLSIPGHVDDRVDDRVTTISMPDLLNTTGKGVLFGYCPNLTEVFLPKLATVVGDLVAIGNPELKELSLPALANVTGGALIDGDFDEIHLPNLKSVAYLNIKSTGDLDCAALGKNLSSLAFTPPKYYFGASPGFTCRARFGESTYNSSDPDGSATPTASGSSGGSTSTRSGSAASSTSGSAANPTSTTSEAGNIFQVRLPAAFLCSGAMALFGGLLIG